MASKGIQWLWIIGIIAALCVGIVLGRNSFKTVENFDDGTCDVCSRPKPCGCMVSAAIESSQQLPSPVPSNNCNACHKPRPCGCPHNPWNQGPNTGIGAGAGSGMGGSGSGSGSGGFGKAPINQYDQQDMTKILGSKSVQEVKNLKELLSKTVCPPCEQPDMSKWIMKTSVPPCPPIPDMSRYMLKTECPPQPDMSKYVLKSSVPKCPPCISTCSKPCKIGECPPCPRPRCPTVQCPEPKACPAVPAAVCEPCPEPAIQCNAKYEPKNNVRPMLASTSVFGF